MSRRVGAPITLDVDMALGRWTDDIFRLEIKDQEANVRIIEIELTKEQFVDLLTNRHVETNAKLFSSEKFGKKMVHKSVYLDIGEVAYSIELVQEQGRIWEKENPEWTIDNSDLKQWNGHRSNRDGTYSVSARRWVDK